MYVCINGLLFFFTNGDSIGNIEKNTLIQLSKTSSHYRIICSSQYDYLWKILTQEILHSINNYQHIHDFNDMNNTFMDNWYLVYKYIYELRITYNQLSNESKHGHIEFVKYLVQNGLNRTENLSDALWDASQNGHLNVVKYLVNQGANIHILEDQPLISASENGHLNVVRYLISLGADVRSQNDSALTLALTNGYLDVANYLVSRGANENAQNNGALKRATVINNIQ